MSGAEILIEMKKNPALSHLPVVMFSGAKPTDVILYDCKHADLYFVKPDGPDKYFAVVKSLEEYCRKILNCPNSTRKYAEEVRRLFRAPEHCDLQRDWSCEELLGLVARRGGADRRWGADHCMRVLYR